MSDLQVEHGSLKLEHRKTMELHNQQVSQLKRDKDNEILNLQGEYLCLWVSKLFTSRLKFCFGSSAEELEPLRFYCDLGHH